MAAHNTYLKLKISDKLRRFTSVLMSGKIVGTDGAQQKKETVPELSMPSLTIQSTKQAVTTTLVSSTLDKVISGSLLINLLKMKRRNSL
jgi:hypothetical protein